VIPINDKLYDILCSIKGEGNNNKLFSFQGDTVTHAFQKYIKKLGIKKKLSLHSLRHTFASHLAPDYLKLSVQKLPF